MRDVVAATPTAVAVTLTAVGVTSTRWGKNLVFACRPKKLERGMMNAGSAVESSAVDVADVESSAVDDDAVQSGFVESPTVQIFDEDVPPSCDCYSRRRGELTYNNNNKKS